MENSISSDITRNSPTDIQRITTSAMEAGYIVSEVFRARMVITQEMKATFLKDPARFMALFFEQRGHRVNGFNITLAADQRVRKIVTASDGDVELHEVVVHVVQGGVVTETTPPHIEVTASQYL